MLHFEAPEKDKMKEPKVTTGEPARARKRKRPAKSSATAVSAAEGAARRVEGLVTAVQERVACLLEAQRAKPDRWQYFASIAELEDRLRQALDGG